MSPQVTDTDRFHGIDASYSTRLVQTAFCDGRLTSNDADLILSFIAEREVTKNISVKRAYKLASSLIVLRRIIGPFRENSVLSIYAGIKKLHSESSKRGTEYKENTKRDLVIILKSFYLWLIENEEVSIPLRKIQAIQPPPKVTSTKSVQDLLTPDEIQSLILACTRSRDRALFFMMYEGGFRVGEMGCMKWGDLKFDSSGIRVNVTFKTGKPRYIRLVMSKEPLAAWKAVYPKTITNDSLVFLNYKNEPLTHAAVMRQLERITEKAGITRRVTPHIFRHSRITHLIQQGISESVIKLMMWGTVNSQMFATYAHLTGKDIDREFFELYGLSEEHQEHIEKNLEPKICSYCNEICSPMSKYCFVCGNLLGSDMITDDKHLQEFLLKNAASLSAYLNTIAALHE
ncbi:MAG TPA: site-specific integrase [Methanospirillum sp.]|nr:site-specific integrase [Methanospirillum sp.]